MTFFYILTRWWTIWGTKHWPHQKIAFTLNLLATIVQQALGFISSGIFYGTFSAFIRYYVDTAPDIFAPDVRDRLKAYPIASVLENFLLCILMILTLVSISMGRTVRDERVSIILKFVCILLCFFNMLTLVAAYYKLFTIQPNLSFFVTGIYIVSYLVPPIFYDYKRFWCNIWP
jgi:hypothetical protein